jgi:hypothetical protein
LFIFDPHHGTSPQDADKSKDEKYLNGTKVRHPPSLVDEHPPTETEEKNQVRCTKAPLCSSELRRGCPQDADPHSDKSSNNCTYNGPVQENLPHGKDHAHIWRGLPTATNGANTPANRMCVIRSTDDEGAGDPHSASFLPAMTHTTCVMAQGDMCHVTAALRFSSDPRSY